ncbi:protein phosphatase 1 regulatory subunit 3E [Pygocentrus nattereri]|uniref:protein phosphatase 1 regulatory subunit 3E n=1 Tax=Pygocentrus nattereri TaxID=42514 RepID=UPI0008149EF7|nr:protein phosphatase 1 regulatory subunit 3E [Pygocentrus nattereri]
MDAESVCPAAVMLPPKNCIPRNYSCIAGLFGSLATSQKMDDGDGEKADGEEEEEMVNGECEPLEIRVVDERPRGRESFLKPPPQSPTQRRRCKSLPSPAERARLEIARSRSPNSQKKVRFADSLGLELISVKHFDDADVPEIPERVMDKFRKARALHLNNFEASNGSAQSVFMELLFTNPGASADFIERVKELKVSLERVNADEFCLSGLVRVLNMAFEKSVGLRYTLNNWSTFVDAPATYVPHSSDGLTDKFSFKIVTPFLEAGGTLQFAIKYLVDGHEFWDNNDGDNYKVRRHRFKISPPREWENGWIHFI